MAGRGISVKRGLLSESALLVLVLALLLLCSHSWATCRSVQEQCIPTLTANTEPNTPLCYTGSTLPSCGWENDGTCFSIGRCLCNSFPSGEGCPAVRDWWPGGGLSGYYTGLVSGSSQCSSSFGCTAARRSCHYTIMCSTKAEADSVASSLSARDTAIFVCSESYEYNYQTGQAKQPFMQLYRCDCKWNSQTNTGTCNGKTNIDPKIDCELVMNVPGTCNDNGYQQGPNTDTTGSNATCYAVVGSTCHMRDNRSGNTFTCTCDGNCNYAYEQMKRGFCENPYTSSDSQDSTIEVFGSSSSMGGSSDSQGGSSSSGEDSSASQDTSDFEYDYTSLLEAIQANTQGTMNNTQNIDANFVQVNTNINNVTTAVNNASSNISSSVNTASSNIGGKLNTLIDDFGEYTSMWASYKDSILHPQVDVAFDSGYHNDSIGMFRDSVARHVHDIDSILDALGDTTTNYIVFDSIYDWKDTASIKDKLGGFFFNAPASNSCPVFNLEVKDMPIMGDMDWSIDFGNFFGRLDFCELIRALVRLGTLIAIVFGTIQAFRKAFGNGG